MTTRIRSEVFLREDLQDILAAITLTVHMTGGNSPHDAAYRRGFATAIAAIATATHIDISDVAELAGRPGTRIVWRELAP